MKKKRNIVLGLCIIFLIVVTFLGYSIIKCKPITSIEKYGQWDREDLKGNLDVFPKILDENWKPEYYYNCQKSLLDGDYQIYLKCEFDEKEFEEEVKRLQSIENTYEGKKHTIVYDSENFCYPAYVAIFNFDSTYEYVLMDEENNIIYYIYLQFINKEEIKFEEKLLPNNYLEGAVRYNIYAYEFEEMDGWHYNKE